MLGCHRLTGETLPPAHHDSFTFLKRKTKRTATAQGGNPFLGAACSSGRAELTWGDSFLVPLMLDASRLPPHRPPPPEAGGDTDCARLPPRFPLGRVTATPGALLLLTASGGDVFALLLRHSQGDWGNLTPDDAAANDAALLDGGRLLSAYELGGDGRSHEAGRVWILTEADRSFTTLLLPEEY